MLLFSVLFGLSLVGLGERVRPLVHILDHAGQTLFQMVGMIMRLAPIGAFGAMAFTVGKYGVGTLLSLGKLMGSFYLTCVLFVFVVLGLITRVTGFSLLKFLRYIGEEILIVLGTSSSESALAYVEGCCRRHGQRVHHARGHVVGGAHHPGGRPGTEPRGGSLMSEARAITNLIGNAVASMAIARWEGALDLAKARRVLNSEL